MEDRTIQVPQVSEEIIQAIGVKPQRPWTRRLTRIVSDKADNLIGDSKVYCMQKGVDVPYPADLGTFQEVLGEIEAAYTPIPVRRFSPNPVQVSGNSFELRGKWVSKGQTLDSLPKGIYVLDTETADIEVCTDVYRLVRVCIVAVAHDCLTGLTWVWVSPGLDSDTFPLLTLEPGSIVIGQNVSYDRQFVQGEYALKPTRTRFVDIRALHTCIRGITSSQRIQLNLETRYGSSWRREACQGSLEAFSEFYLGRTLDKGVRREIVKEGLPYFRSHLKAVIHYCAQDVQTTLDVFKVVYPEYREHVPSVVNQKATELLGSVYAPISPSFPKWVQEVEGRYQVTRQHLDTLTLQVARRVSDQYLAGQLGGDRKLQLDSLDWTLAKTGKNKGQPKWLRALTGYSQMIVPVVFGATYKGSPIVYQDRHYSVLEGYSLPHPEAEGEVLSKFFVKGLPTLLPDIGYSESEFRQLLDAFQSLTIWEAIRSRVLGLNVMPITDADGLAFLPDICPNGTLTRRSTDKTILVFPHAKPNSIGSEVLSLIQAPEGYVLVKADVDQQELVLAGYIGDTQEGQVGSSTLSLINLVGDKSRGTDLHSLVAKAQGLPRDVVKSEVYAACYQGGKAGNKAYLLKHLPVERRKEVDALSDLFFDSFRGKRRWEDNQPVYSGGLASEFFNGVNEAVNRVEPTAPILGAKMPLPVLLDPDAGTTKGNWIVQTSGVDARDLFIVFLDYLVNRYLPNSDTRLCFTRHDEYVYITEQHNAKRLAYLFQIARLLTSAVTLDRLGLEGLPYSGTYFSSVEIDRIYRKDSTKPVQTPTYTHTELGESLCITSLSA